MFLIVSAPSGVPKYSGKLVANLVKVSGPEIHGIRDFQATKFTSPCSFQALEYSQLTKKRNSKKLGGSANLWNVKL